MTTGLFDTSTRNRYHQGKNDREKIIMRDNGRQWEIMDLLKAAEKHFKEKEIEAPRLHAEILLAYVMQATRIELYLKHDRPVSRSELEKFRSLCRERLNGKPLQYITGEQIFYGHSFLVDERVLIPRPETELVLEHTLDRAVVSDIPEGQKLTILDIGTGSGCLAIMLALKLPDAIITAVDFSAKALEVAKHNAGEHGVADRIRFLQTDVLCSGFIDEVAGAYDVVLSNPPYIPEQEWEELAPEVKNHEPKMALVTPDGFEFYRAISRSASALLKPGGMLCFELHAEGAEKVREIVDTHGFRNVEVHKDYSGWDRVLSGVSAAVGEVVPREGARARTCRGS